jgi:hypothetical protein
MTRETLSNQVLAAIDELDLILELQDLLNIIIDSPEQPNDDHYSRIRLMASLYRENTELRFQTLRDTLQTIMSSVHKTVARS